MNNEIIKKLNYILICGYLSIPFYNTEKELFQKFSMILIENKIKFLVRYDFRKKYNDIFYVDFNENEIEKINQIKKGEIYGNRSISDWRKWYR